MRILPALLLFLVGFSALSHAQSSSLFMPRNLRNAYDKGTRSFDGKPGPRYWQNHSTYDINVAVNLKTRLVSGNESIRYDNNSPDSLGMIRLKLAHDLWKKNGQRGYDLPLEDITDGVLVTDVKAGGKTVDKAKINQANTFLDIQLPQKLAPGKSLDLTLAWSYTAPAKNVPRECVCDSTSWFAAYWYPQVAVYDDLHGWADAPYNGLQEMYNDFSDYTVRISVPGNVMVWATGVLDNAAELFTPEYLGRYNRALEATEVVKIFSPEDYAAKKAFFKPADTHTFIYKAQSVPDFAFGLSDHYLWDGRSATVDAATGRKAGVFAAYNPASKDYYEVCQIDARALELFSTWLPGYPYPYPRMTVFNGDDGMEFPMMCNDVSTAPNSPIGLTVHESAHTYFPFMMGINEQYYAWMDEGWAAFFDVVVTDSIAGKSQGRLRNYPDYAGTDADMPPMVPARHLTSPAYRVASYNRPQAAYFNLLQLLGYDKFHHCMVEYMNRWKGKHPQPFDFFNTWNEAAGENLDWFWKPWFFDWGYPDLAVGAIDNNGKSKCRVWVENRGTMPSTVALEVQYADGTKEKFTQPASVWKTKATSVPVLVKSGKKIIKVTLGGSQISDADPTNNTWEIK